MTPDLSVILAIGERRDRAPACLASLLAQEGIERIEILLYDLAPGEPEPLPGSGHPSVVVQRLPPETLFSVAKARGVEAARAPIVTFVEEHCRAFPGWAAALIAAHDGPYAGVGPEVHNGNATVPFSRSIHVVNYQMFYPGAARGERGMLPGHNSSWKRNVLLGYGERLEEYLRAEIVLHLRLVADGHRLLLEPAAKLAHWNESDLASASRGRYLWNRIYAHERAKAFGWSRARRGGYVLAAPLIPIYSVIRLMLWLRRHRPDLMAVALFGLPRIAAVAVVAALGHSAGLLLGPGDAEARFTWFEMNEHRDAGPA
ncbi:MAG TPA: glycosyltransferase [Thermoanaerobaculia bacterium]|nr:glycosyltransferase [Thermoanaerobaculia bacterium]